MKTVAIIFIVLIAHAIFATAEDQKKETKADDDLKRSHDQKGLRSEEKKPSNAHVAISLGDGRTIEAPSKTRQSTTSQKKSLKLTQPNNTGRAAGKDASQPADPKKNSHNVGSKTNVTPGKKVKKEKPTNN